MNEITETRCTYCGRASAPEEDHVIARQFFPPEHIFRGDLPKVPACGECNRRKQRIEDTVAVYLQFGHSSSASAGVLQNRIPRTLRKNLRLLRSLKMALRQILVRRESGVLVPALAFKLDDQVLTQVHDWFCIVTRGLYRHESGVNLPENHSVHLVKPTKWQQYNGLLNMILGDSQHVRRSLAHGEFQYAFAISRVDPISAWLFSFKSVEVFVATLGPECPETLRRSIAEVEWDKP